METYFSIVVPVYRTEKYLEECIESVIKQNFRRFELILVDNGSDDGSPALCDQYSDRDTRITTIHLEKNVGISSARNIGIENAKGKYLLFLDADDYYDADDFFEIVYNKLEEKKTDILLYKAVHYCDETGKYDNMPKKFDLEYMESKDFNETLKYLLRTDNFWIAAWSKAVRTDLVKENHLFFEHDLVGEDIDWSIKILNYIKSISAINYPRYVHRMSRHSTALKQKNGKSCMDICDTLEKWGKFYEDEKNGIEFSNELLGYLAYQYYILLGVCLNVEKSEKGKVIQRIKQLEWLTNYEVNSKTHYCHILYKIVGRKMTMHILKFYVEKILKR